MMDMSDTTTATQAAADLVNAGWDTDDVNAAIDSLIASGLAIDSDDETLLTGDEVDVIIKQLRSERVLRPSTDTDRGDPMMLTYHNDPNLKAQVLAELAAHREADQIVQGDYWTDGRGCAVGRLTHDPDGGHDQYPIRWGIPKQLACLEDRVFEGLPESEARLWPERVMAAIPVGVDLDALRLVDRLAVARLRSLLDLAPTWPGSVRDRVVGAIEGVIAALESGDKDARSAARSAAWSASADSTAESAAWSAWSAGPAESASWSAEADRILTALEALTPATEARP
jgi:hypothetical protein